MTTARLRECLRILNWSSETLAHVVHVSPGEALRWVKGHSVIPLETGRWLSTLAFLHEEARQAIATSCRPDQGLVH